MTARPSPSVLHHIQPRWVLDPSGRDRRAEPERIGFWQPLQKLLDSIGSLFSVEIVLIDQDAVCVAGTGPYAAGIGLTAPPDTALAHSLSSRDCVLIHTPRENAACRGCSLRDECRDHANYSGPLSVAGQVVAAAQIVAFDTLQKSALLERAEAVFGVIGQLVGLLFQSGGLPGIAGRMEAGGPGFHGLIGNSAPMAQLRRQILRAAASDSTVLITGETGTGKDLTARAIHAESGRKGAFVPVNCGALPEQLAESELFGYGRGAFSGASPGGRQGLWEAAHGGTLFLDEVGELSPAMQVKLLRALQDGGIRRVGENAARRFDTRIIAATNRPLAERVREGSMRQDLYYRLKVIPLRVPALRERPEDISLLAQHFLKECCTRNAGRMVAIGAELMHHFMQYAWPGNVRELRNCIEYGVNACEGAAITWTLLADYFDQPEEVPAAPVSGADKTREGGGGTSRPGRRLRSGPGREDARRTLEECEAEPDARGKGWAKREAARRLGVSLATLYRLLKREE